MPFASPILAQHVHIWRIGLVQEAATLAQLRELLNEEELQRTKRFIFPRDQRRFMVARASLRKILGFYLNVLPQGIQFFYGPQGKPYLNSHLQFNLSHSGELALVAVSSVYEVGIDLECHRHIENLDALAQRVFSEREYGEFKQGDKQLKEQLFYHGWTRKEAFIKANGQGLFRNLKSFSVSLQIMPSLLEVAESTTELSHWQLFSFYPEKGYTGALAVDCPVNTQLTLDYFLFQL